MIAKIIINITAKNLQQTFSYEVPPHLDIQLGARVQVPFGHRQEEGIVVALHDKLPDSAAFVLKPVTRVLSSLKGFQEEMLETARWISEYYLCNISDALRLFMIEKKGLLSKNFLVPGNRDACETAEEYAVFDYVGAREKIDAKQLSQRFPQISLEVLLRRQILQEQPFLINKIADKTEPWLCPAKPDAGESLKRRPRQTALFAELVQHGAAPFTYWVGRGYSRPVLNELVSTGLARMEQRNRRTTDLTHSLTPDQPWQLNPAQERAVKAVEQDQTGKTFVLHGVTGSGKTEIYLQLTEKVLRQGRQVIVLVPEIALTGQIVRRFIRRFGNDVVVQHSQLSKGERRNNWLRMFNKESHICIGARSAIFTAVADLGMLIVDEAHDTSYKQDESPRYDAVEVARKRAAYYHCPLILGSATPSINSYYKARQGEYELLELPERVAGQALPDVSIVDMREELARGNYRVLSDELANLLNATLEQHHQAIILLNRRGFSTFVMCRKCGYVVKCETCDVAMVYHKDQGMLKCHYCDNEKPVPTVCPSCGSKYIKYFGTGTEKVEEQLRELLPQARIIRLDQDTTTRKGSGDKIIEAFRRHEYDILLGTQMVAKGHDFPDVTAVGILAADSLLNLPAYWAGERTFQLLTQAAGRSGRGNVAGRVVMQTYAPEHYVIQCSKTQDYEEFYEKEIAYRRELMYPPFHDLIKIIVTYEDSQLTWERANGLALLLRHYSQEGQMPEIIGPYVDTIKKIRNKYRVCLLIKGKDLAGIKKYIKNEADFYKTGIIIDVDPSY